MQVLLPLNTFCKRTFRNPPGLTRTIRGQWWFLCIGEPLQVFTLCLHSSLPPAPPVGSPTGGGGLRRGEQPGAGGGLRRGEERGSGGRGVTHLSCSCYLRYPAISCSPAQDLLTTSSPPIYPLTFTSPGHSHTYTQ